MRFLVLKLLDLMVPKQDLDDITERRQTLDLLRGLLPINTYQFQFLTAASIDSSSATSSSLDFLVKKLLKELLPARRF